MAKIETKGFEVLGTKDKEQFTKLSSEYSKKYARKLRGLTHLLFHLKENRKEGNARKSSINIRATDNLKVYEVSSSGWDFKKTLHKALEKLQTKIEHSLYK